MSHPRQVKNKIYQDFTALWLLSCVALLAFMALERAPAALRTSHVPVVDVADGRIADKVSKHRRSSASLGVQRHKAPPALRAPAEQPQDIALHGVWTSLPAAGDIRVAEHPAHRRMGAVSSFHEPRAPPAA